MRGCTYVRGTTECYYRAVVASTAKRWIGPILHQSKLLLFFDVPPKLQHTWVRIHCCSTQSPYDVMVCQHHLQLLSTPHCPPSLSLSLSPFVNALSLSLSLSLYVPGCHFRITVKHRVRKLLSNLIIPNPPYLLHFYSAPALVSSTRDGGFLINLIPVLLLTTTYGDKYAFDHVRTSIPPVERPSSRWSGLSVECDLSDQLQAVAAVPSLFVWGVNGRETNIPMFPTHFPSYP